MFPAIFLDRDGVIIENRETYVRSWAEVAFYPFALAALASLCASPYKIVLVTNQSAVGRGIITLEAAQQITRQVIQTIESHGGRINGAFMCPHAPQDGCDCRKPRPGLILRAAAELSLDLDRSIMVGDAISDLLAGQNAGIQRLFLVRTGRGAVQEKLPEARLLNAFQACDTFADVLTYL